MKLLMIKVTLCLILVKTNVAIFENPFQIRNLFGYVLEIGSKIVELRIDDENVNTLLKKISTFRHEIEEASTSIGNPNINDFSNHQVALRSFLKMLPCAFMAI